MTPVPATGALAFAFVIGGVQLSAQWPPRPDNWDIATGIADTSNIVDRNIPSSEVLRRGVQRCRATTPPFTSDSIGPVRTGMTTAELDRVCPHVWHLWLHNLDYQPAIGVVLGELFVLAVVHDTFPTGKIQYAFATDSAAHTSRGVGVGSTFSAFEKMHGRGRPRAGSECAVEAVFGSLPRISVVLDQTHIQSQCGEEEHAKIPGDTRIKILYLDPKPEPTPVEVARGSGSGPKSVSDSAFVAATSVRWPPPSAAYEAGKIPWGTGAIPECGSSTPTITGDSLGPLAVRGAEAALLKRCPRVLHVWVLEGEGEPALALKLGDARIIARMTDTTVNGTVRLIVISDPAPRTSEGFGVGTRLSELLAVHRDPAVISGKGSCVLFFSRSLRGLTFVLRPEDCRTPRKPGERLEQIFPPQARVNEIWIKGSH